MHALTSHKRGMPSSGVSESETRRPDVEARPGEYGGEYGMPPIAPISRRWRCASAAFAWMTRARGLSLLSVHSKEAETVCQ